MSIRRKNNRTVRIALAAALLCAMALFCACTKQDAVLVYASKSDTEQTPSPSPVSSVPEATPYYEVLTIPAVTGHPFREDINGIPISDELTHYFTYYLSFTDLRVYEEEGYTYLDGVCTNHCSVPLSGQCDIIFTGDDGIRRGIGTLHTADSDRSLFLQSGANNIYAEILSEESVLLTDFDLEVTGAFLPAAQ